MATVYLNENDTVGVFGPSNIYGASGRESVLIYDGARDVRLSPSVEEAHFALTASAYQFRAASGALEVWKDGVRVASIPVSADGAAEARFADGSARISVNPESGAVSLGGRELTTTPSATDIALDASRPSDEAVRDPGAAPDSDPDLPDDPDVQPDDPDAKPDDPDTEPDFPDMPVPPGPDGPGSQPDGPGSEPEKPDPEKPSPGGNGTVEGTADHADVFTFTGADLRGRILSDPTWGDGDTLNLSLARDDDLAGTRVRNVENVLITASGEVKEASFDAAILENEGGAASNISLDFAAPAGDDVWSRFVVDNAGAHAFAGGGNFRALVLKGVKDGLVVDGSNLEVISFEDCVGTPAVTVNGMPPILLGQHIIRTTHVDASVLPSGSTLILSGGKSISADVGAAITVDNRLDTVQAEVDGGKVWGGITKTDVEGVLTVVGTGNTDVTFVAHRDGGILENLGQDGDVVEVDASGLSGELLVYDRNISYDAASEGLFGLADGVGLDVTFGAGGGSVFTAVVGDVVVRGGSGVENVSIGTRMRGGSVDSAHAFDFSGGKGGDEVHVGDGLTTSTILTGDFVLDGGDDEDTLRISGESRLVGDVRITNVEKVYIQDGSLTVKDNAILSSGTGADDNWTFTLDGSGVFAVERESDNDLDLSGVTYGRFAGTTIEIRDSGLGGTVTLNTAPEIFHVASKHDGTITAVSGFQGGMHMENFRGVPGDRLAFAGATAAEDKSAVLSAGQGVDALIAAVDAAAAGTIYWAVNDGAGCAVMKTEAGEWLAVTLTGVTGSMGADSFELTTAG